MTIHILLVEDDELFRLGLAIRLQHEEDVKIVAEVNDGETALEIVQSQRVELVILDVGLPGWGGVETCIQIKNIAPALPVLVLTSHSQPALIHQLIAAKANGYCLKGIPGNTLVLAIRSLVAGATWWDPKATQEIQGAFPPREQGQPPRSNPLTQREQEILGLMSQGQSNQEIARHLYLSVGTVKVHVHAILQKLEVKDRAAATRLALQNQWV